MCFISIPSQSENYQKSFVLYNFKQFKSKTKITKLIST